MIDTRERGVAALVVAVAIALVAGAALVAQEPSTYHPTGEAALRVQVHQLKVENARLRATLAEVQAALDSERLTDERAALEQQLRDEIKPPAEATFDWTKGAFVPPPQEPPK